MRFLIPLFLLIASVHSETLAQNTTTPGQADYQKLGLSALVGYNFNGQSDWANLTPDVFLGWEEYLTGDQNSPFVLKMQLGPTISSPGNVRDTSSFFRSLMLPGNASLSGILYGLQKVGDWKFILAGGAGLKVISGLKDTSKVIAQSNARLGFGIHFPKNLGALFCQYTWGWHNLTTESENNFKTIFGQSDTKVRYLTVNLQTYMPPVGLYLYLSWRKFLNSDDFPLIANDSKIITIGIRKDIELIPIRTIQSQ